MQTIISQKTIVCDLCKRISPDDGEIRGDRHAEPNCEGSFIETTLLLDFETGAAKLTTRDGVEVLVAFGPEGIEEEPIATGPLN